MSIYLAWSVYKLVGGLTFALIISLLVLFVKTTKPRWQKAAVTLVTTLLIVLGMAFNIGVRQQELDRSAFNAPPPTVVEVVEVAPVKRLTKEDVKVTFESAVKRTQ